MAARSRIARDPVHHPHFARWYARLAPLADERLGLARYRAELVAGLSGRVIEIGAGSGLNFRHFPGTVSEVVAIEPERHLRMRAADEALRAEVPVDVAPGVAEALPVKSEAFDGAVACLVLCSVRDQRRALAELFRVLRPGGQLRLLEHCRAEGRGLVAVQWMADHTAWPLLAGGCHTGRDTLAAVRAAGFEIVEQRPLRIPPGRFPVPSAPHVLATARRPA
ncbi:class I SAM-dependent methyltransferase [Streptomyces sp. H10-C2]|uniref:class I SAM-dependent methyltransferase n=1 Tax=unclassified Streptomyces TaxID=2593676 RepID=UPI0024BBC07A|nr:MULTISPECIES: class I SAM-dependent methyltransferase [unclassified Streptomyces]MDJ0344094.1 class I SAM-dependent methyltransferase [Streptomyces sp. PH10-H1]MDJ0368633.1 class I SAM-dependent methyltransferase [Streptomyces sp. H10-C2]